MKCVTYLLRNTHYVYKWVGVSRPTIDLFKSSLEFDCLFKYKLMNENQSNSIKLCASYPKFLSALF